MHSGVVVSHIDITERRKNEQREQAELSILSELHTGYHNLDAVFGKLLKLLDRHLGYITGAFYSFNEWSKSLEMIISRNVEKGHVIPRYNFENNVLADAITRKKTLALDVKNYCLLPLDKKFTNDHKLRYITVAPIYYNDRVHGVLLLGTCKKDARDEPELKFLERIGVQLGIFLNGVKQFENLKLLSQQLSARQTEIERQYLELEHANRAKTEFLTNMSHELRTPLNSVIGFSELLEMQYFGGLNERQMEYASFIKESGEHLLELINDILDLSKIEAGTMTPDLQEVYLPHLLQGSLRMFNEKSMKKKINLILDLDNRLGTVIADIRKIKQVVYNLLANALKFTPEGGHVVLAAALDGDNVLISVSDNGIGIAEEDKDKLFKEFSQVDGSLSRRHEGTGLGLALSKRLVEMHNGRIWVESRLGEGSKFTFVIPIGTNQDKTTSPQLSSPKQGNLKDNKKIPVENPVIVLTAKILTSEDYNRLKGMAELVKEKEILSPTTLLSEVNRILRGISPEGSDKNGPE